MSALELQHGEYCPRRLQVAWEVREGGMRRWEFAQVFCKCLVRGANLVVVIWMRWCLVMLAMVEMIPQPAAWFPGRVLRLPRLDLVSFEALATAAVAMVLMEVVMRWRWRRMEWGSESLLYMTL